MGKYAGLQSTAYGLLASKGAPVVITRLRHSKGFDPVTQAETKTRLTDTFVGVGLPMGKALEYDGGSLSIANGLEFTLAHKATPAFTPEPGDQIAWAGRNWTVRHVNPINPAADGAVIFTVYGER
jgi:hypothetical protein